jgi:hypothetical protein
MDKSYQSDWYGHLPEVKKKFLCDYPIVLSTVVPDRSPARLSDGSKDFEKKNKSKSRLTSIIGTDKGFSCARLS